MRLTRHPDHVVAPFGFTCRRERPRGYLARWIASLGVALFFSGVGRADPVWLGTIDANFGNPGNWSGGTPGASTIVQFGSSTQTQVNLASTSAAVAGIVFSAQAPAYTLTLLSASSPGESLAIGGGGISNLSGELERLVTASLNSSIQISGQGALIQGRVEIDNVTLLSSTAFTSGASAGSATIVNTGGGATIFNQASAGQAHISVGASSNLTFSGSASGGAAQIANLSGGTTAFNDASSAANATLNNAGTLAFAGSASAAQALIANSATLLFGNLATAGAAHITNASGGLVEFTDQSQAGSALITNQAGGSVVFQGAATAPAARIVNQSGATLDVSGSLASSVEIGSLSGGGTVALGSTRLALGAANQNDSFTGVMTGTSGSLVKEGSGTLVFAGTNLSGGLTQVNAGVLEVDGSLAGGLAVATGASASGVGTIGGGLSIAPGATLLAAVPGSGLRVTGDVSFAPQSRLVTVLNAGGSAGELTTQGQIHLTGAILEINLAQPASNFTAGSVFPLIQAGAGVSGQFASVESPFSNLVAGLHYSADAVDLVLAAAKPLTPGSQSTPNQSGTAAGASGIGALVGPLSGIAPAALGGALDSLDASPYSTLRQAAVADSAQFAADLAARVALAPPCALTDPRPLGWIALVSGGTSLAGDSNAAGYDSQTEGLRIGADLMRSWIGGLGIAAQLTTTHYGFQGGLGSATASTTQLGLSLDRSIRAVRVSGVLSYRIETEDVARSVMLPGIESTAGARTRLSGWTGLVRIDWPLSLAPTLLSPYLSLEWTDLSGGGFDERGAGVADLVGSAAHVSGNTAAFGILAAQSLSLPQLGAPLRVDASLAWSHQAGSNSAAVLAHFEDSPAALGFDSLGVHLPRDRALLQAGLLNALSPALDFEARLLGSGNGRVRELRAALGVRYRW